MNKENELFWVADVTQHGHSSIINYENNKNKPILCSVCAEPVNFVLTKRYEERGQERYMVV